MVFVLKQLLCNIYRVIFVGFPAQVKRGADGYNAGGLAAGSNIPVEQSGRRRMQKLFRRAQSFDPRRRAVDRLSAGSDGGKKDLDTHSSGSSIEGTPPRPILRGPLQTGIKRQHDQMGTSAENRSSQGYDRMSSAPASLDSSMHSDFDGLALAGQGALIVTPSKDSPPPTGSEDTGQQEEVQLPENSANNGESEGLIVGLVASNSNYQGPPTPSSESRKQHPPDASIMSLTKVKPVTIASFKPTHPYYPGSQPVPSSHSNHSRNEHFSHDSRSSRDASKEVQVSPTAASTNGVKETSKREVPNECQKSPDLAEVLDLIDVHFSMAHENEPDASDTSNITSPELLANLTSAKSERAPSFVQPGILTTENGAVLNISPRSRSRMHKQDSPKVRRVIKPDIMDFDRESPSPEKDDLVKNVKTEYDELFPQDKLNSVKNHTGVSSGASSLLTTPDDVFVAGRSISYEGQSSMESSYISAVESRPDTETETDDLTTPDSLSSPEKAFTNGSSPSFPTMQDSKSLSTDGTQKPCTSPRSYRPVKAEYSVSTTSRVLGADAGRRSRQTSVSESEKQSDLDMSRSMIETKQEGPSVVTKHSISYESGLETIGGGDGTRVFRQISDNTEFITSVKDMCLDFSRKLGLSGTDSLETESTTDSGIVRDQSDKTPFSDKAETFYRSISAKEFSSKFNTWTGSGACQKKQRKSLGNEQVRIIMYSN